MQHVLRAWRLVHSLVIFVLYPTNDVNPEILFRTWLGRFLVRGARYFMSGATSASSSEGMECSEDFKSTEIIFSREFVGTCP